jgi:hypothetical protein
MSVGLPDSQGDISLSPFKSFGLIGESALLRLSSPIADIAGKIRQQLLEMTVQVTGCLTASDFRQLRDELFPQFLKLVTAQNDVVMAKVDKAELPQLIQSSFGELEDTFTSDGISYFTDDEQKEILFSISTLRSATALFPQLIALKVDDKELIAQDVELASQFLVHLNWSIFHLCALVHVMARNKIIVPEVLQEMLDGLRSSVMAYAAIRQALDVRNAFAERYQEAISASWDAEDEALAHAD